MTHVADWKKDVVNELEGIIRDHSTVAVVKIDRIPGVQMQNIRAKLRDQMTIKVAKKNLIRIAFDSLKGEKAGIEKLDDLVDGQAAVLGTNLNPYTLFKILGQNIQPMPAKGGEEAPEDIVVPAGETSFPPGPIVGEFGKAGIPAAIDKGKVVIRKTVTPVKQGGIISKEVAFALTKLEIFPFRVGIVLDGAWEDGEIYRPKDLDIDMDAYRSQMTYGAQMALNLAVFTAYVTPLTAVPILQKARIEAFNLAVFAGILNRDTADLILSKAYGGMLALARLMSAEALDNDLQGILEGAAAARQENAPAAPKDKKVEESKEKETEEATPTEEDGMAGLGALFG
ncbi:MAG: 50S ribosomal protein L10 [Candidatus Thermoplasmatota archaeon]|nr:50S ribosomal protein L10 [Candidatus Thermoplasmatota archaeon]